MLRPSLLATMSAALGLSFVIACPSPGDGPAEGEGEGEGEGEQPGDGNCPVVEGANSVCDVQDSASDNAVLTGALVTLPGVVATSQVFGSSFTAGTPTEPRVPTRFSVYVANSPMAKRGGVLVTWLAEANLPTTIAVGDVITVTGQVSEFTLADTGGTETRVDASAITIDGGNTPLAPLPVTQADLLGAKAEDYEGAFVVVEGGEVAATGERDFTLTDGLTVANAIFGYAATVGETFTSITGVVRFDIFGGTGMQLLPRAGSDVVSDSRPTRTVTELNDGTVPRCPGDSGFNQCVQVISGIVTSPVDRLDDGDAVRGPLFGFYVADPANLENGRFGPKSGIFVLASPANTRETLSLSGYTFDAADRFWATGSPQIGDLVEIVGDNAVNFDQGALRNTTEIKKVGTDVVPLPALFGTGGRPTSDLKGGRPASDLGDFTTGFTPPLEGIAPSATIEDWENVLVELKDVTTTTDCYAQAFTGGIARDFGNFLVTGDVEIGTEFFLSQPFGGLFARGAAAADQTCDDAKCEDSRVLGQSFTSLTGIVGFSFGVHRVSPRTVDDFGGATFAAENSGTCAAP